MAIAIGLFQIYSIMPIQKARVLERHSLLKTNPFPAILSFSALEHVIAQPRRASYARQSSHHLHHNLDFFSYFFEDSASVVIHPTFML